MPGFGQPRWLWRPKESSGPKALVATQAEAVSQLAWGRERGVLPVQKGLIPHLDRPPLFLQAHWENVMPEVLGYLPPWLHGPAQCPLLSWVPERRARTFAEEPSVSLLCSAVIWSSQPPWEGVHSRVSRARVYCPLSPDPVQRRQTSTEPLRVWMDKAKGAEGEPSRMVKADSGQGGQRRPFWGEWPRWVLKGKQDSVR